MINQIAASFIVAAFAFWGMFQLYPRVFPTNSPEPVQLSLEETIRMLKRELADVAGTPGETAGLVLSTVKLELTTEENASQGLKGELAVPVFDAASLSAGETAELKQGSKVTVTFDASAGEELLSTDHTPGIDLSTLVLATRKALLATIAEPPQLTPKSVDLNVNFVFTRSREQGSAIKVQLIEVGSSAKQGESTGNSILLSYVNPLLADKDKDLAAPR